MEKYIAFELFKKNEHGGHQPALDLSAHKKTGVQVHLVAEVEDLQMRIEDLARKLETEIAVAYNEYSNGQRAAYEDAARLLRSLMERKS